MSKDLALVPSAPITKQINNKDVDFYPLSLRATLKIKTLAKPIATALAVLFADTKTDIAKTTEEFQNVPEGLVSSKLNLQAISTDLAKMRSDQKQKAFADLVDAFLDEKNMDALTEIVLDSLRIKASAQDAKGYQNEWDVTMMVELLKGVLEANVRVFGPLAVKVKEAMVQTSLLSPQQASPASETSARNENGSAQPTQPQQASEGVIA